jgi:CheY-like chemotaxis protein
MPDAERSVLYVDQRLIDLLLMQLAVRRRPNLALHVAFSGAQALKLAPTLTPSVLLIGLDLPDGHGAELLRQLRRIPSCAQAPAVALTADGHSDVLASGFRELWSKPLNLTTVGARLDHLCRAARAESGSPAAATEGGDAPRLDDDGWPLTQSGVQAPFLPPHTASPQAQGGW